MLLGFFAALSLLDAPTVMALRRGPTPVETPAGDELPPLELPAVAFLLLASSAFQSTLPLRGATILAEETEMSLLEIRKPRNTGIF